MLMDAARVSLPADFDWCKHSLSGDTKDREDGSTSII